MDAGDLGLRVAQQILERQRERTGNKAGDGERPVRDIEPGNAKMAEDNRLIRQRMALPHLMRKQREPTEETLRFKSGAVHVG